MRHQRHRDRDPASSTPRPGQAELGPDPLRGCRLEERRERIDGLLPVAGGKPQVRLQAGPGLLAIGPQALDRHPEAIGEEVHRGHGRLDQPVLESAHVRPETACPGAIRSPTRAGTVVMNTLDVGREPNALAAEGKDPTLFAWPQVWAADGGYGRLAMGGLRPSSRLLSTAILYASARSCTRAAKRSASGDPGADSAS